ncbi:MAG: class I SAM-dependent methyltransferase [Opitutaceae bacterium]
MKQPALSSKTYIEHVQRLENDLKTDDALRLAVGGEFIATGKLGNRPDWRFEHSDGITIPCTDAEADFVCFFSVFTHLSQEDMFRHLREANRVLNRVDCSCFHS